MNKINNKILIGAAVAVVALIGVLVFLPGPGPDRREAASAVERDRLPQRPGGTFADSAPEQRTTEIALTPVPTPTPTPRATEDPGSDATTDSVTQAEGEGGDPTEMADAAGRPGQMDSPDDDEETRHPRGGGPDGAPEVMAFPVAGDVGRYGSTNYNPGTAGRPTSGVGNNARNPGDGSAEDDADRDPTQPSPTPSPTPRPSPSPTPTPDPGHASMYLDPAVITVTEEDFFTLNLYVNSAEKPVAGYTTFIMYVPIEAEIVQIREGRNSLLGHPMVAQNNPETGVLVLAGLQASSMSQPTGEIHLLSIDFEALRPGTLEVNLVESEVANTDAQTMILTSARGARVTVQPLDAVD
ncbi:MAG: hypothetical protein JJU11_00925 [Candidatus Sumerlaeia bacterium]|nr:hypothetical protein [Candidatus Sumerlaeia bacterium]